MSTICEKDRKNSERKRQSNDRGAREIGEGERDAGGRRGGRDSLPGPVLIVPGNEGVIK